MDFKISPKPILIAGSTLLFFQTPIFAHKGRTDSSGGHKGPGGYHYHNSGLANQEGGSNSQKIKLTMPTSSIEKNESGLTKEKAFFKIKNSFLEDKDINVTGIIETKDILLIIGGYKKNQITFVYALKYNENPFLSSKKDAMGIYHFYSKEVLGEIFLPIYNGSKNFIWTTGLSNFQTTAEIDRDKRGSLFSFRQNEDESYLFRIYFGDFNLQEYDSNDEKYQKSFDLFLDENKKNQLIQGLKGAYYSTGGNSNPSSSDESEPLFTVSTPPTNDPKQPEPLKPTPPKFFRQLKRANGLFLDDQNKPFSGKVIEEFQPGLTKRVIPLHNGVLHGVVETFYKNGRLEGKVSFKNGSPSGQAILYDEDGNLVGRGE